MPELLTDKINRMRKDVKDFLLKQGLTERDLEYKPNFTFMKVELMLQKALDKGQNLPLDSVSVSCFDCNKEYVETKKTDISYDTNEDTHYVDILIRYCPDCGSVDDIHEY